MQQTNKEPSPTVQTKEEDSYTFTLRKIKPNPRLIDVSVSVHFPLASKSVPQKGKNDQEIDNAPSNSFPVFNYDYKYYTPCFILGVDKPKVFQHHEFYLEAHWQRVEEMNQEIQQILVPKPSAKYTNCALCRTQYSDYLQHIQSQKHRENHRKSNISKNMNSLLRLLTKREKKREKLEKQLEKKMKKQSHIKEKKISKQAKVRAISTAFKKCSQQIAQLKYQPLWVSFEQILWLMIICIIFSYIFDIQQDSLILKPSNYRIRYLSLSNSMEGEESDFLNNNRSSDF